MVFFWPAANGPAPRMASGGNGSSHAHEGGAGEPRARRPMPTPRANASVDETRGRMQTQCLRIPLLPGKTPRFLDWVAMVRGREHEAFEAMTGEGAVAEGLFLERAPAGDHVVYYMR